MHKEKQDNQSRDEFVIKSFHNIISLFLSFFSSSLEFEDAIPSGNGAHAKEDRHSSIDQEFVVCDSKFKFSSFKL
jgi:hypothetical protein